MPEIVPISLLDAATALDGTEQVPVTKDGVTVRTTSQDIADLAEIPTQVSLISTQVPYTAAANTNGAAFDISMSGLSTQQVGTSTFPAKDFATHLGGLDRNLVASAASTNSSAAVYNSQLGLSVYRAFSGGEGGGFSMGWVFGFVAQASGQRAFCGAVPRNSDPCLSGDPSAKANILGVGKDAADTNLQFMHNDASGVATKVDLGVDFTTLLGKALRLELSVLSGGASASYRLTDLETDTEYTGTVTTNLPAADEALNPHCGVNTGAGSSAISAAVNMYTVLKST